jgi:hypothetical protein
VLGSYIILIESDGNLNLNELFSVLYILGYLILIESEGNLNLVVFYYFGMLFLFYIFLSVMKK